MGAALESVLSFVPRLDWLSTGAPTARACPVRVVA
jgi:hypothetical protein